MHVSQFLHFLPTSGITRLFSVSFEAQVKLSHCNVCQLIIYTCILIIVLACLLYNVYV